MSDTKTLDPEAKQAEENERLKNVFENDQREGEIEALNKQFAAPSFTPPHEIGDPQQPATGDVPLKDSTPGDSSTPSDSAPTASKTDGGSPAQDDNTRPTGKGKWRDRAKKWNEMRKKGIKNTAKDAAKEAAKKAMKKVAEQAAKRAADAVAPGAGEATVRVTKGLYKGGKTLVQTGNLIQAGQELGQQAMSLLKLAAIIAIIIVTVFVIIIIPVIAFFLDEESQELQRQSETPVTTLTLTKSGPSTGSANELLRYEMHAISTVPTTDITITDTIPTNTQFSSATGNYTCDNGTCNSASRRITWHTKDMTNPQDATVSLTVKVNSGVSNTKIINVASATSEEQTAVAGAYVSPADINSCSGKYASYISGRNNLLPKNYGDPQCSFTKDKLYAFLMQQENRNTKFVNYWFYDIIPGESGYNPNAFAPPVGEQARIDAGGAWGLFQMGSSTPPGSQPPAPGKNGPYDRGDVNWEVQATNAITYNRTKLQCDFWYWATYRRVHSRVKQC